MNAIGAAGSTFREQMLNADPQGLYSQNDFNSFGSWISRRMRYDLYWSLYQNNVYQTVIHPAWAHQYKTAFGLYKHTRNIYNPAYRLGEFWASRLMGGGLDKDAGDGEGENSALPILTDNESIRPALAKLWTDSQWQIRKDLFCRWGSVLGDVGLMVDDDTRTGKVSIRVVHPGKIAWVRWDESHTEITAYVIEEQRADPRQTILDQRDNPGLTWVQRTVIYREEAFLDGQTVHYRTLLDNAPYPWNGVSGEWDVPYGFIPLVLCQHETAGMDWGVAAFHSGLSRFREVDDQASGLGDQIRKAIRAPAIIAGVASPKVQPGPNGKRSSWESPEEDRQESAYLYVAETDVKVEHLTFPLDIAGVANHIKDLIADIEKNYPELMSDVQTASGDASGRALRVARAVAASKVQARRAAYDDTLVRAQQMAIAIGGWRKYKGYQGFDLTSIASGKLDHRIGHRQVFEVDPNDELESEGLFWGNVNSAVKSGVPLELYLKRQGWSTEEIGELTKAKKEAMNQAAALVGTQGDIRAPLAGDMTKQPPAGPSGVADSGPPKGQ